MWDKILKSSVNPNELSLTVKGLLLTIVPVVMVILKLAGHEIGNDDLQKIVEATAGVVATFASLVSAIMVVWGIMRKLWVEAKPKS